MEDLLSTFASRMNGLLDLEDIKEALKDDDEICKTECDKLARTSLLLARSVKEYRVEKERSQELSKELLDLLAQMKSMNEKIQSMSENIPQFLPGSQRRNASDSHALHESSQEDKALSVKKTGAAVSKKPATGRSKAKQVSLPPTLTYITAPEFTSVPRYMKGRILYSEANKAIDVLNQSAVEKYNIVNKVKALNDYQRRKKLDFQSQESKDTEKAHFVTDADITEFTSTKLDRHFQTLLPILRHCGRLRQVRNGKITKHILLGP